MHTRDSAHAYICEMIIDTKQMTMAEPVNLLKLKSSDFKKFLDSFDHVFSDCDGVIWANTPLPGSGEFFKKIKTHGKTVHYVSNNSLRTKQDYEAHFKSVDIENGFENLTIPSKAIAEYLKSVNFDKKVYCVTCPETIHVLNSYGFTCIEGSEVGPAWYMQYLEDDLDVVFDRDFRYCPEVGPAYYQEYIKYLEDDLEVGAVVFDSDFRVNLPKLYKALTYLQRPEVLFINGATDKYVTYKPGCLALATGVFNDLVVDESKRQPIQLGKPGKMFGEFALKRAGVTDPSRVLFIGDMIEQDVGLGKAIGFKTLLVLTNNTKEDMLAHETIRPDYYADSLGSIVPLL